LASCLEPGVAGSRSEVVGILALRHLDRQTSLVEVVVAGCVGGRYNVRQAGETITVCPPHAPSEL